MRFTLANLAAQNGYRRKVTTFRAITPPKSMGEELARIYLEALSPWVKAIPRINAAYERTQSALSHDATPDLDAALADPDAQVASLHPNEAIACLLYTSDAADE